VRSCGRENTLCRTTAPLSREEDGRTRSLLNSRAVALPLLATKWCARAPGATTPKILDFFTCLRPHRDNHAPVAFCNSERYLKISFEDERAFCGLPEAIAKPPRNSQRVASHAEDLGDPIPVYHTPNHQYTKWIFFAIRRVKAASPLRRTDATRNAGPGCNPASTFTSKHSTRRFFPDCLGYRSFCREKTFGTGSGAAAIARLLLTRNHCRRPVGRNPRRGDSFRRTR